MKPLRLLVDVFVNTFGITRPSPEQEKRAGRAILAMLVAVLALLAGVFLVLRSMLARWAVGASGEAFRPSNDCGD